MTENTDNKDNKNKLINFMKMPDGKYVAILSLYELAKIRSHNLRKEDKSPSHPPSLTA